MSKPPYSWKLSGYGQLLKALNEIDGELPVEWSAYMNQNAKENDSPRKETKYVFGPLVDTTPRNLNTVLTSIIFIEV